MAIQCKICGAEEDEKVYCENIKDELVINQLCYECNFWEKRITEHTNNPNSVIINSMAYMISAEEAVGCRGFSGQKFTIKFLDWRTVETTNLWCQGKIPGRFLNRLNSNAEII
jgi:hypothetical protein